ncbi:MAG: hypothetical protein ACOCXC_05160 [Fibrobacterota bacterium]
MKLHPLFLFLFVPAFQLCSQSYEGYIGSSLPVWFEIDPEPKEGIVRGSYFYKKNFSPISLSGERSGRKITLEEKNSKQKTTGNFTLTDRGDSLKGIWKNPKNSRTFNVVLYRTDPAYKPASKLPGARQLGLEEEMRQYGDPSCEVSKLEYLFSRKHILSVSYRYECMAAYPSGETVYHTYYVGKEAGELDLWNELDSAGAAAFKQDLLTHIQESLNELRSSISDSEWIDIFRKENLDSIFTATDEKRDEAVNKYYFRNNRIVYEINHYFGFPHAIQAMDLFCDVEFSFRKLGMYLKKDSKLKALAEK